MSGKEKEVTIRFREKDAFQHYFDLITSAKEGMTLEEEEEEEETIIKGALSEAIKNEYISAQSFSCGNPAELTGAGIRAQTRFSSEWNPCQRALDTYSFSNMVDKASWYGVLYGRAVNPPI